MPGQPWLDLVRPGGTLCQLVMSGLVGPGRTWWDTLPADNAWSGLVGPSQAWWDLIMPGGTW